ncbi:MAG: SlyX family protein [Deltaproteobacteria bacterium]|nr:SlyX family protein [Deltaproteobacteria bacterium]
MEEERLVEIETRLAYQGKLLSDLDEVMQGFTDHIAKLERKIRLLEGALLESREEMEPHNTPPPHY